jgi:putative ABC transport system permease protein
VFGTTPEYFNIGNLRLKKGRFISDLDMKYANSICVLGADAKKELFGYKNPLGKKIKIGDKYFQVVGVLCGRKIAKIGAIQVRNINNDIYIPYSVFANKFGKTTFVFEAGRLEMIEVEVDELIINIKDPGAVLDTAGVIKSYLKKSHPKGDYEMVVPLELLKQHEKTQRIFNIVMISIALISLIVGGIGIMNIMLANVAERTKEIGTRRALGARRTDILKQFLIEAVVLSLVGGCIGIVTGIVGAYAIANLAGWKMLITYYVVIAAFVISSLTGIIFGTYPAYKAARLNPIEALRME